MQPLSLTFNVFLTVFVSDHINEGTLQVNHEALQVTFYSVVPVTAWHYNYIATVLLGICNKAKSIANDSNWCDSSAFFTMIKALWMWYSEYTYE